MKTEVLQLMKLIILADIPQPPVSPESVLSKSALLLLGLLAASIIPISFVVIKTIKKKHSTTDGADTEIRSVL